MRFLIDRCAGKRIADWLCDHGHDVVESRDRGADPGDRVLLGWAAVEKRVLITMDQDFGQLIFVENAPHCGLVRLPDIPATKRIELMDRLLRDHTQEIAGGAILTVRGERIRISRIP